MNWLHLGSFLSVRSAQSDQSVHKWSVYGFERLILQVLPIKLLACSQSSVGHFEGIQKSGIQTFVYIDAFHLQNDRLGRPVMTNESTLNNKLICLKPVGFLLLCSITL